MLSSAVRGYLREQRYQKQWAGREARAFYYIDILVNLSCIVLDNHSMVTLLRLNL